MGLMGTLDTMSLGDLLQWISTARKSGVVTVAQGKSRLQLAVAGSRILGSYSNEPPMLLGQFLLSRGKIDEVTLHDALAQLPANYRDVITLYELEELPIDEVARRMHRRKGALYMMRARAIERLQAILGSGGRVS